MKYLVRCVVGAAFVALVSQSAVVASSSAVGFQAADAAGGTLSSKIKSRIDAEPEFKGSDVTVEAAGGVVTLRGVATNAVVRVKIVELAKATDGVTKVQNKIAIAKSKN